MIDILPYSQKVVIKRIRTMRIITVVLWAIILLLGATALLFLPTLQTINSRYSITTAQMDHLEQSGVIIKSADVVSFERRLVVIKNKLALKTPPAPMAYVERIRTYAQGIELTGYTINSADKPIVQVRGVASTRQALQQFVTALQNDTTIAVVDSPIANFVKSNQGSFTLTVTFKNL
jgi:hypothetical protein